MLTPKYLHENYMALFCGAVNDGKSYQCDSAFEARAPNGDHVLEGGLWISTETSTSGTAKCWADIDRVHVVRCNTVAEVRATIQKWLPAPNPSADHVPRLPSGRRIDALVLDSWTGLFQLEKTEVAKEFAKATAADANKRHVNKTSMTLSENNDRDIARHVAHRVCQAADDFHGATSLYRLLALATIHDKGAYVDRKVPKLGGGTEIVSDYVGRKMDVSESVVKKLRQAANMIWFMHAVLPNFVGRDAGMINRARHENDPTLHRRYAAITERGTFPAPIGELGDVCKRQGDGEGSPWQVAFGAAVPTWWHPDFVTLPDVNSDGGDVPCAQPNFGKILELAISIPRDR